MMSLYDIVQKINQSEEFELAWSAKEDLIRHTAIVVILDTSPTFTIDYGAPQGEKLLQSGNIGIEINLFMPINKIKKSLCKFSIWNQSAKEKAIYLLQRILSVSMGKYHLLANNCRDFVEKAKEIIKDEDIGVSSRQHHHFDHGIAQIRQEDDRYLLTAGAVAGGLVVGALLFGSLFSTNEKKNSSSSSQRW